MLSDTKSHQNLKFIFKILIFIFLATFVTISCSKESKKDIDNASKSSLSADDKSGQTYEYQESEENKVANYEKLTVGDTQNPFYIIGRVFAVSKKNLLTSLYFLIVLWLILSLLYYIFEHRAQPKVYRNYGVSFLWTFLNSTRDPGALSPNRPVTTAGKIIASIIGLQAIIVVAIPTGILSSGYIKVMEEENKKEYIINNINRIQKAFKWVEKDGLYLTPEFKPIDNFITKQNLSQEEVIEAVKHSPELNLYNLSKAYNNEDEPIDRIVVVACPHNRPYGYCVDRGSNVTIVSTSGYDEPITSWVAYHIAKIGGFNYVAKEIEQNIDEPISYYRFDNEDIDDNLKLFLDDVNKLSSRPNSWVIPMSAAAGPKSREHKFHLLYSFNKGDERYDPSSITLNDSTTFQELFDDMNDTMSKEFEMPCDKNTYYAVPSNSIAKHLKCKNVFIFRPEATVIYLSSQKVKMIKIFAEIFNKHLEPGVKKQIPQEMLKKPKKTYGYSGYVD